MASSGDTIPSDTNSNKITDIEDITAKAEEYKTKANEYFKDKDYAHAIEFYTSAIDLKSDVAAYFGNRAFAYIKTECFGYALDDANKALSIDSNYLKAYYRRATANMSLGKFAVALKDFEAVKNAKPNDKDAKMKYTECSKIVMVQRFQRAIAVEDKVKKSIADQINLEQMSISNNYPGPHLSDDNKVTQQFVDKLIETFVQQKSLHRKYAFTILFSIKEYFSTCKTLVDITVPKDNKFTICGDIHGQFYDLVNIFKLNGMPSETNPYLFNGDFVDRGSFSVECILTLFSFKLLFPNHFFLSRGNHESNTMNQMYGFDGEVVSKYSTLMQELFSEVFQLLPLSHCINEKILVMHGGLFSEDNVSLDDIRTLDRNKQPPETGIMCCLLWSDPMPQMGRSPSKRGVGVQFGPDVTQKFLTYNNLDYIIRSHEVKDNGYEEMHGGKCITVFSAPNYCDAMGNKGAFITIKGDDLTPKYTTYTAVPHPDVKPMAYANSLLSMLS